MWTSEAEGELLAVGLDAEDSGRFAPGADAWSWDDVFSPRELAHARAAKDGARVLCASFCAKEALFKALGAPYPPDECELCWEPGSTTQTLSLPPSLRAEHGIAEARVRVTWSDDGECRVVLHLFGPAPEV